MVEISPQLSLHPVNPVDRQQLYTFMQRIYPPAYQHFWQDQGQWYLDYIYGPEAFARDMSAANAFFYFVYWQGELIGIYRWLEEEPLMDLPEKRATKLQRIYLAPEAQGKGIGKQLLKWLIERQKDLGYQILWLDVMDVQEQAKKFYASLGFMETSHVFLEFPLMHDAVRRMNRVYLKL
ncbi:MAG: GNAT family N-acetyltransferase [Bacteroidota bacterium]